MARCEGLSVYSEGLSFNDRLELTADQMVKCRDAAKALVIASAITHLWTNQQANVLGAAYTHLVAGAEGLQLRYDELMRDRLAATQAQAERLRGRE